MNTLDEIVLEMIHNAGRERVFFPTVLFKRYGMYQKGASEDV
jgi:hypothetical protein